MVVSEIQQSKEKVLDFEGIVRWETALKKAMLLHRVLLHFKKISEKNISSFEIKRRAEIMLIKEAQKDLTREEVEKWDLRTDEDGI
uniref:Phage protein n=1 Tax=Syphacia muris TaxID=451379 RepID=A0A0N5AYE4_9BILA